MNRKRFSKGEKFVWTVITCLVVLLLLYWGLNELGLLPEALITTENENLTGTSESSNPIPANIDYSQSDSKLEIYFFDVGQADSILLRQGEAVMLVDTGNAGDAETSYKVTNKINLSHELQRLGVKRINYLIATHPHEDHMGSMYKIINLFDVENVYANNILPEGEQAGYYKRFVSALETSNSHFIAHTNLSENEILAKIAEYNANVPESQQVSYNPADYFRVGDVIGLGEASITILAPNSSSYYDTNDSSIVLMVEFQGVRILLTGDAGLTSEADIIQWSRMNGFSLKADVLKVGHHGSRTASSEVFISLVNPKYAIVMVAESNSYGLPDEEPIERLERHGATVYMTKDVGDIKMVVQNGQISFDLGFSHEEKEAK